MDQILTPTISKSAIKAVGNVRIYSKFQPDSKKSMMPKKPTLVIRVVTVSV